MPRTGDFLKAFNLCVNNHVGSYLVRGVNASHNVEKRFQQYSFDIKLRLQAHTTKTVFSPPDNNLEHLPLEILSKLESKVVNSQFGNPYFCFIKDWKVTAQSKDGELMWLSGKGWANRMQKKKSTKSTKRKRVTMPKSRKPRKTSKQKTNE